MRILTLSLVGTARLRRPRRVQRRNGHELCIGRGLFRPLLRGRGRRKRAIPTLLKNSVQMRTKTEAKRVKLAIFCFLIMFSKNHPGSCTF